MFFVNFYNFLLGCYGVCFMYALLMRGTSEIPMAYYIYKPPLVFDDTLPKEG